MKPSFVALYTDLKNVFVEEIKTEIKKIGRIIPIYREIPIFAHTVPTETKLIKEIKVLEEDGHDTYLVHCFYTDIDTKEVSEEWEILRDLPMDELYEIADTFEL